MTIQNRQLKTLIVADEFSKIHPLKDSTVLIGAEFLRRDWQVFWTTPSLLEHRFDSRSPHLGIAYPVTQLRPGQDAQPFVEYDVPIELDFNHMSVIQHRKDPPVDHVYQSICDRFRELPRHILQINEPHSLTQYFEHEVPMMFPQYSIPTHKVSTHAEITALFERYPQGIVYKPHNEFGGRGVQLLKESSQVATLPAQTPAVIQPYRELAASQGDTRILTFDGQIIACLGRVPKQGGFVANLAQGGNAVARTATSRQLEAVEQSTAFFSERGLYFLGYDFIGDEISEVNFTCPTTLLSANHLYNTHCEQRLVDLIVELLG